VNRRHFTTVALFAAMAGLLRRVRVSRPEGGLSDEADAGRTVVEGEAFVEIRCGSNHFSIPGSRQRNPDLTVQLGTVVCWANVDDAPQAIVGGPWRGSGAIGTNAAFIWTANQVGSFVYRSPDKPGMRARLTVVA
jgi:hypothetical protein